MHPLNCPLGTPWCTEHEPPDAPDNWAECAVTHRPDVIVLDVQMPELDSVAAAREIARAAPQTAILIADHVRRRLRISGDAGRRGRVRAERCDPGRNRPGNSRRRGR